MGNYIKKGKTSITSRRSMFLGGRYRILLLITSVLFPLCAASALFAEKAATGNITYTLTKVANPTADQQDAYAKITIAMDSALYFYNSYTSITKKLTVSYDTSVATADGNSNGSIRFGKSRSYMVTCTAMHETSHTVGIGTSTAWSKLIVNGRYSGSNANGVFQTIIGRKDSVLLGDAQHFWPYGLNYSSEVKSVNDLINHCKIVEAMQRDFYPAPVLAGVSGNNKFDFDVSLHSGNTLSYTMPSDGVMELGLYTLAGQRLAVLDQGMKNAGIHTVIASGIVVSTGLYMYRLRVGGRELTRSFVTRK